MQVKSIAECSKGEHSAILSTFIKLPFVIKVFVLSILRGHFTQVLLYTCISQNCCMLQSLLRLEGVRISFTHNTLDRQYLGQSCYLKLVYLCQSDHPLLNIPPYILLYYNNVYVKLGYHEDTTISNQFFIYFYFHLTLGINV